MAQNIVIVESPAKAKTINKYLGSDYTVVASFGHIRDLPPKDGSVRPDEDFAMDWALSDRADRPVAEIVKLAKTADSIYLASDPDREGEAIAWHVYEVLNEKKAIKSAKVYRVTFNEITKSAVLNAMAHPREIDQNLVDAYMARRALDYLVGFSLSPVLWRKLPGSKSAGRVQSVSLRLICERESEIEKFRSQEFWSLEAIFATKSNASFGAHLTHLNGEKLDKFAIQTEAEATATRLVLEGLPYSVKQVEKKQVKRNPYPPFTTSTLQQEASRKLGLSATRTMKTAQKLYEGVDIGGETVGLITYMRTDGVTIAGEALAAIRQTITSDFGDRYLPPSPRAYKTTAKNAQEAHEAIRPTNTSRHPDQVARALDHDELKLYTLIWQRTMASQMANVILDQVSVDIAGGDQAIFRATGSTVVFDGWLKVYQDSKDDDDKGTLFGDENDTRLPPLNEKEQLTKKELIPEQHFTQPPPRYTEASLVKRMEELGIGRPSTYASIMQVLQDRDYVRLDKKRFIPEDRGRIVTAFLENFFGTYVQYDFTADLEEKLDDISGGKIDWKKVMRGFWKDFSTAIDGTKELKITDVINALDEALGPHFFPPQQDGSDPRKCALCGTGRMGLKLGKYGAFIGCSNYPDCRNTMPLAVTDSSNDNALKIFAPKLLGADDATQLPITVRSGPYGAYVQLGPKEKTEAEKAEEEEKKSVKKKKSAKDTAEKPKRVSLPKGMDPNLVNLQTAQGLLALPRTIGKHPETDETITAGIGRFGSYLKVGSRYKTLAEVDDVLSIGINRAVVLLAEPDKGGNRPGRVAGKVLGNHPKDDKSISLNSGRFGPYVKWGKVMATVTKAYDPENLTLEQAIEIIETKAAKGKPVKATAAKTEKKAPKKPAAKKPTPKAKKPKGKTT